jgi:hypothetical protein
MQITVHTGMRTVLIPLLAIYSKSLSVMNVSQCFSRISRAFGLLAISRSLDPWQEEKGEPAIHFSRTNQEPEWSSFSSSYIPECRERRTQVEPTLLSVAQDIAFRGEVLQTLY